MKLKKILVPTDLSAEDAAQAFAANLAKQHGAELLLFHTVVTHAHDVRHAGKLLADSLRRLESDGEKGLEQAGARLRGEDLVVHSAVEQHPSAFEGIMDKVKSWQPDLVVMSTHGRAGMKRWFLGSVAEKVIRHAPCWVATVRPGERPVAAPIARILVPVDFSDSSRRALDVAIDLKETAAGTLILQHVVLNPTFAGFHPAEYVRIFEVDPGLPDRLRQQLREWMAEEPFEAEVHEAEDIAASILDVAENQRADLIVMGTRGRTGIDYFIMGSVAEKIVRAAPVPVLTIK
jgi:nucleotide-binding universal stress UspA family protein